MPKSIIELSQKYVPILKKLEALGARAAQREAAIIRNVRRIAKGSVKRSLERSRLGRGGKNFCYCIGQRERASV